MTIRVAIVGCGAIADYLHAPAVSAADECELTALVDTDVQQAQRLAAKYNGVTVAEDLSQIADKIDLVALATPPHVRVSIVAQAFAAGLHVLCEKPLANHVSQCVAMRDLAKQSNRMLGVFHQFRFWPNRQRIRDLLLAGTTSPPEKVSVSQGGLYSWNSVSGYSVKKELVPGGVLINAGIHPMDTLISWFGDPIDCNYWDDACGGLESNVRMSMTFAGGVSGTFRLSRTCRLKNEIRIQWRDHAIRMTNNDPFGYVVEHADGRSETVECGASVHGFHQPAIDVYNNFASAIRDGSPLEVDVTEGMRVVRWVESCYQQKHQRPLPELAPIPGLTW